MNKILIILTLLGITFGTNLLLKAPKTAIVNPGTGVIIYALTNCSACHKAQELLTEHNIAFKVKNIDVNEQANKEFRELGFSTVPQIYVDGKHIGGLAALTELIQQGKL